MCNNRKRDLKKKKIQITFLPANYKTKQEFVNVIP